MGQQVYLSMLGGRSIKIALLGTLWLAALFGGVVRMGESAKRDIRPKTDRQVITLGGGCFWCVEAIFNELRGVIEVESGYSGGSVANPSYEQVCTGRTGHAEVVRITFDPKVVALEELLNIFFTVHDPTTLNRQGADVGTQYRSVIFYRSDDQKDAAERVIKDIQSVHLWNAPIVTELAPFKAFYRAEDYHQRYFELNGRQPYCRAVIEPKVAKFREHYRTLLKK
jgi:peptide-methionine (S)-S-oxide reductase